MLSFGTFDAITNLNLSSAKQVECHKNGFLVGVTLIKIAGQVNPLDTLTWTIEIFADVADTLSKIVYRATLTTPDYDLDIPFSEDRQSINEYYESNFFSLGVETIPTLRCKITVAGMANAPVTPYEYMIRIETKPKF